MSHTPFVLPAGLDLAIGEALTISYAGDVSLEQSLGRPLGVVHAGGDLTVALDVVQGELRAGGKLEVHGRIDADTLHGREVILHSGDIKCRAISADERIVIGAAKLSVDIIIAPEIVFEPKASGRVTVIQANTEIGPTKIRGGFSLSEYEEAVGDPVVFLEERGVAALAERLKSGAPAPAPVPEKAPVPPPAPKPVPRAAPMTGDTLVNVVPTAPPPSPIAAAPVALPPPPEEDVGDPMSLAIEDLEPVKVQEDTDELHPKLMDAVKRIAACYEGKEVPPAVTMLRELVEARDYDRLRENITEVWNGLLGYHQKKGIRPHHQVTHAFNVIHGLVQQG